MRESVDSTPASAHALEQPDRIRFGSSHNVPPGADLLALRATDWIIWDSKPWCGDPRTPNRLLVDEPANMVARWP